MPKHVVEKFAGYLLVRMRQLARAERAGLELLAIFAVQSYFDHRIVVLVDENEMVANQPKLGRRSPEYARLDIHLGVGWC